MMADDMTAFMCEDRRDQFIGDRFDQTGCYNDERLVVPVCVRVGNNVQFQVHLRNVDFHLFSDILQHRVILRKLLFADAEPGRHILYSELFLIPVLHK